MIHGTKSSSISLMVYSMGMVIELVACDCKSFFPDVADVLRQSFSANKSSSLIRWKQTKSYIQREYKKVWNDSLW